MDPSSTSVNLRRKKVSHQKENILIYIELNNNQQKNVHRKKVQFSTFL